MKIRPVGAEWVPADGQRNRKKEGDMTKLVIAFSNFGNAPNKTENRRKLELQNCRVLLSRICTTRAPLITLKADSHIPCRSHTSPMPFPYYSMPLRV
jgi:hypothetical protein